MAEMTGFYKFRCKYFLTFNCENWVWVNHTACAECVAAGRDDEHIVDNTLSCEIISPFVELGRLLYEVVELEEGLPDEDTAVARRCRGNHQPESWETAAHVHPCYQD